MWGDLKFTISLCRSLLRWYWTPDTFVGDNDQKNSRDRWILVALFQAVCSPTSNSRPGTAGLRKSNSKRNSWLLSFKQFWTTHVTREWRIWFSMAVCQGQVESPHHPLHSFLFIEFPRGRHYSRGWAWSKGKLPPSSGVTSQGRENESSPDSILVTWNKLEPGGPLSSIILAFGAFSSLTIDIGGPAHCRQCHL